MSQGAGARPSLADLGLAVADGTPIDWQAVSSEVAAPQERVLIDRLRVIQQIAAIHRQHAESAAVSVLDELREDTQRSAPAAGGGGASAGPAWGHLHLIESIGRGAFGEVYRARDTRLDREVALKILRRAESRRADLATSVVEEGRLLARVRHPNVVTVHGADRIGEHVGVWMELVQGRTLEELLQRRGPFALGDLIRVGTDLCRALGAVHRAGLVHRDVKAENAMQDQDGRTILMDFGVGFETPGQPTARVDASPADANARHAPLTGTPLYLAPEIFDGHAATVQSDLYAVGVLLYHLATGSYPVAGRTADELRAAHTRGESTPLAVRRPDLNRRFVAIVQRALARNAADRYQSADAMEAALEHLRGGSDIKRRIRRYSAAIAISAAVILGVVWLAGWRQGAPPESVVNLTASGAELLAVDRRGDVVWRHRVPDAAEVNIKGKTFVRDVDGDGSVEVLANVSAVGLQASSAQSAIYCFSQQGDLRWRRTLDERLKFRAGEYGPPWVWRDLLVFRAGGASRVAAAATHHTWWPSVLLLLDARGQLTGERFVSAGWMMSLGVSADSRYLLAAGVNNAHGKAAMLAVLDAANPSGASPEAPGSEFECDGCPSGRPLKYFVFSESDVKRASASELAISSIIPTGDGVQLRVAELQAIHLPTQGIPTTPEAIYDFSSDLQLRHASFTDSHWEWHRRLEAEGRLDHPADRCPERAGVPIRVWAPGTGWRDLSWPTR